MLTICLCIGIFAFSSNAQEEVIAGKLEILSYNIAGLPIPSFLRTKGEIAGRNYKKDTEEISKIVGATDFDLVGVQEDFNAHAQMVKHMDAYEWQTFTSGGVPYGDGLNFFSKQPLFNAERTKWNKAYGILDNASDELTPKGILYCLWEIAPGIYVDVYTLHCEAGSSEGSLDARWDNLTQLAELVNERSVARAAILLGDFNSNLGDEDDRLYELLIEPAGLKDAWAEVHNGGAYTGIPNKVDGIDRVLYRNGGDVSLKAVFEEKGEYLNSEGKTLSDHPYCHVTLEYEFTGAPKQMVGLKKLTAENPLSFLERMIKGIFKALSLIIKDLPSLF